VGSGNHQGDHFAVHAAAVARDLFGEPNRQLSTKDELRFGTHGSMAVNLKTGAFYDHQHGEGGGVLWAIEREKGQTVAGGKAIEWMRANGYDVEDTRPAPPPRSAPARLDPAGNWLPQRVPDHGCLTKTYDYRDAAGTLAYQVCRYDWTVDPATNPKGHEKTFVQRRPDASKPNGWAYKMEGVTWLPYRLPELLEDIRGGYEIFFVEGEKKVDMLRELGVPATCNHGGAGKFPEDLVPWFKGAKLVQMPDNDDAGRAHMDLVARRVAPVAASVRRLDLPGLPPKGGVDDWLPAGGSADKLYDLAAGAAPFEAAPYKSLFGAVRWRDFDAPGPTYEYLIKGVLTENEISLLLGESQSGKSFVAIDLAMSVARGVPFFGHQTRRGGVIYQAGESATGVRRRRFPAYARHHDVRGDDLPVVLLERPVDFYTSDDQVDQFIEECRHWATTFRDPLKLVIIDTFNRATPGANENDGKDMGVVLARCDRIRRATGAHVMLVHHLNAGGTKARGHTSLFGNVENVVTVRRVPDSKDADGRQLREWVVSKAKDGEDGITRKFVLRQVEIGRDAEGDPITSCVAQQPEGAAPVPDDPEGITVAGANATILRATYEAVQTKGVIAPQYLGLGRGALAVEKRDLQAMIKATLDASDDDEDGPKPRDGESPEQAEARFKNARRQLVKRARDYLYSKGVIGQKDDWTWFTGKKVRGFGPPPGLGEEAQRRADGRGRGRRRGEGAEAPQAPADDLPFDVPDEKLDGFY
jgi:hypothetical protein